MTATPEEVLEAMARAVDPSAWQAGRDVKPWGSWKDRQNAARGIIRAALRAARDLGWRMVPSRETPEMLAASIGWRQYDSREGVSGEADMFDRAWSAMISAAPDLLEEK